MGYITVLKTVAARIEGSSPSTPTNFLRKKDLTPLINPIESHAYGRGN